jgi:acyl carrier protein
MALEEEFNLEIADEAAEKLDTVGKVVEYIKTNAKQ